MADGQFDDLLLAVAKQHKTVEELSYSILSFFERRTDLFHIMEGPNERMGFMPGVADRMYFKHFRFFQHRYLARVQPSILRRIHGQEDAASSGSGPTEAQAAAAASQGPPRSLPPPAREPSEEPSCSSGAAAAEEGAVPGETRTLMQHISTWNGAATDKYHWSQSIRDVTLEVEVEEGSRAKDLEVKVTATRLSLKCKGQTILEGKLHEKVQTEDTTWILDDNRVVLSLEKQRETWWKCVLEGDSEIDTTKVESTRKMEEYDGETQGAIRKIMFDQNQKLRGEATSDQIRTADIMKEAWNAEGSPFRGSEFDPSMLNLSGPVGEDFFADVEKKRIEEARKSLEGTGSASDASRSA